jgi:hypothetical protein
MTFTLSSTGAIIGLKFNVRILVKAAPVRKSNSRLAQTALA